MVVWRTILFYLFLVLVVRLMGKRQVAQMEPSEFVVTMLMANLASIPLEELDTPIWIGLASMSTVLALERLLSWICLRSVKARRLCCGKPVILIDNGKVVWENLKKTRVTLDELSGHLRELGVLEIQSVQFAILETNGSVTAFPYPHLKPASAAEAGVEAEKQEMPYTIISDGKILTDNLRLAGKDRQWLDGFLQGKKLPAREVALMTLTPGGKTHVISRRETSMQDDIS